jgi:hypothetical protein
MVSHDPNAVTSQAMRPTFAAEIASRTRWFRSFCTMGCNVNGLKRLPLRERLPWFDFVEGQRATLPRYRDLLLAAIEGDNSQWAYLLNEPIKWRSTQERVVASAFSRFGYQMEMAWHGLNPQKFEAMERRLFLTKTERESA